MKKLIFYSPGAFHYLESKFYSPENRRDTPESIYYSTEIDFHTLKNNFHSPENFWAALVRSINLATGMFSGLEP
jgi:hypothetical protein